MRAFVANCIFIAALLAMPGTSNAQLTKLLGFQKLPSRRANPVAAPARQVPRQPTAGPSEAAVQQLQFEASISPGVPLPTPEASEFAIPIEEATETGQATEHVVGQPTADEQVIHELMPAIPAMEYPIDQGPIITESYPSETVHDSSIGQPYDIPVSNVIPEEEAEIYSTSNWFRGGRWYSKQEFVMLLRADMPNVHIAVDRTEPGGASSIAHSFVNAMNAKDADFTYEAGAKLSIGRILGRDIANRDHSIEFQFLGLFDYTGRARIEEVDPDPISGSGISTLLGSRESQGLGVLGVLGFASFNEVPGFTRARSQEVLYQADLNSFELNYVIGARPARDRLVMQSDGRWVRHATPSKIRGMYAGLRYIRQNEFFKYNSEGGRNRFVANPPDGEPSFQEFIDEEGDYRVRTDNDMFGIQIGGDFVQKKTNWVFGLNARVGGLLNFADRKSRLLQVFDDDDTADVNLATEVTTESLDDETLTFLGEGGAYVAFYVRPNTSFRLGYNVLYLNGVATATNNIGLIGTFPKFEMTGDSLYHGLSAGFEMTW